MTIELSVFSPLIFNALMNVNAIYIDIYIYFPSNMDEKESGYMVYFVQTMRVQ